MVLALDFDALEGVLPMKRPFRKTAADTLRGETTVSFIVRRRS